MKKSQFAIEYMLLIGIFLIALIPVIHYSISTLNTEINSNKAAESVREIGNAADTVYSMGPGNKKFIQVNFPSGKLAIGQNQILFKLKVYKGTTDIFEKTTALLEAGKIGSYTIPSDIENPVQISGGIYNIKIEMKNTSILIGEEYVP